MQFIYEKAITKRHNLHYLNRYFRLLKSFRSYNEKHNYVKGRKKNSDNYIYMESHHILPKSNDLFPEYIDFSLHSWNKVDLTARQHFIAHWVLWKVFGGSQAHAFICFDRQRFNRNTPRSCRITSRIYERALLEQKEYTSEQNKNKACYIDKDGLKIWCRTDDIRVLSGGLISSTKGRKMPKKTPQQLENMRNARNDYFRNKGIRKKIPIYKGIEKRITELNSDDYLSAIEEGWQTKCTQERKSHIAATANRNRIAPNWSTESRINASIRGKNRKHTKETMKLRSEKLRSINKSYEIFVYSKIDDNFCHIDRLDFSDELHIKVTYRIKGVSKKIIHQETGKVLLMNPNLPRLPEGWTYKHPTF